MKLKKGAFALLLEGRSPAATVTLSGEDSGLHGAAEFYPTPLGVVVCAELSGLPERERAEVFGLSLGGEITPIFRKSTGEASAWCAAMTRHRSVGEVLGETVSVLATPAGHGRRDALRIGRGTVCDARCAL